MDRREGRIFAIVGGAAVITGILIGGDAGTVIAAGGAGLGLYGLYIWQRQRGGGRDRRKAALLGDLRWGASWAPKQPQRSEQ